MLISELHTYPCKQIIINGAPPTYRKRVRNGNSMLIPVANLYRILSVNYDLCPKNMVGEASFRIHFVDICWYFPPAIHIAIENHHRLYWRLNYIKIICNWATAM